MKSEFSLLSKVAVGAVVGGLVAKKIVRARRTISLNGKTVLISGGSRGLGLALAREVCHQGARVAICARDAGELDRVEQELCDSGCDARGFVCDMSDADRIEKLIEEVESGFGAIDVLINNVGTIMVGPAESMTIEDFAETMKVNFWSAVHTTLELVARMKERGGGRIVNIASVGGKMPVPHLAAYCTSKFALVGFSGSMRAELAKDGILVTTVNPGLMRTGSPRNATFKGPHKSEFAWFDVSDSLPGLSMGAARAARQIVSAAVHGDAEVTLGLPAKLAAMLYGLAPDTAQELMAILTRIMPRGSDRSRKRGSESESLVTRSPLTYFGRRAGREFNQL